MKGVTAVEPGAGMIAALKDRAALEGITSITCIQKRWEDVDPVRDLTGPYDLVIASLSLTMHDIREAVQKMDAVSCGEVCLVLVRGPAVLGADVCRPCHAAAPKALLSRT